MHPSISQLVTTYGVLSPRFTILRFEPRRQKKFTIISHYLPTDDLQIKENPTDGHKVLVERLEASAELAPVAQTRSSGRISITTEEMSHFEAARKEKESEA
uniref:ADF-H domain-containing protein n=1 Tax=Angiostrongylus cantonensis TaxID=6313 RepID=A0A0K0DKS9_ANGCA